MAMTVLQFRLPLTLICFRADGFCFLHMRAESRHLLASRCQLSVWDALCTLYHTVALLPTEGVEGWWATWHSVPRVLLLSILCVIALANFLGV